MTDEPKWEKIIGTDLSKIKVDGGHLYALNTEDRSLNQMNTAMCFVPDVDLTRYQAHLRDAYMQGFKDGKEDTELKYRNCFVDVQLAKDVKEDTNV